MISNFKFQISNFKDAKGSILLEAFIAIMIISIAFAILLDIGTLSVKTSTAIQKSSKANFLAKEEIEAIRSFRDGTTWPTNGLGSLNTGSANPHYLLLNTGVNPNRWDVISGTETVDIFQRRIVIDKVSRDVATQNIQNPYNASYDDPNTRKVTVTISWEDKTLQLITYFTNWR